MSITVGLEFGAEFMFLGILGLGAFRWGMIKLLNQANETLSNLIKQRNDVIGALQLQASTNEKRIIRLEIEAEAASRHEKHKTEEARILEEALENTMNALIRQKDPASREIADRIGESFAALRKYRRECLESDREWTDRNAIMLIHMEGKVGDGLSAFRAEMEGYVKESKEL